MTAEIAILNRSGVALAADSAVTIGRDRVWKKANKLFAVSDYNDIGVMFYDIGDFCGIPWEIIIKQFRKHIGQREFEYLSECVSEFANFLDNFDKVDDVISTLNYLFIVLNATDDCSSSCKNISHKNKQKIEFDKKAESLIADCKELPELDIVMPSFNDFFEKNGEQIKAFMQSKVKFKPTIKNIKNVSRLCYERTKRQHSSSYDTGIVFAGYGSEEVLPVLEEWCFDGKYNNKTRSWLRRSFDLNDINSPNSFVLPFAQDDIVNLVMEGIQGEYLDFIKYTLEGALEDKCERIIQNYVQNSDKATERSLQKKDNEAIVSGFMDGFKKMRKESTISPILNVISSLPKDEMADMAEALVEITSLRRKVDSQLESVSGPIDVSIISKADGFVWIKRKHYFTLELNKDFGIRRRNRFSGGSDE